MTIKVLAQTRVRVTLAAGANCQAFGTLYTCPAAKRAFIKEILDGLNTSSGAGGQYDIYILKSGATDLTAAASDTPAQARALAEDKTIIQVAADLTMNNSAGTPVLNVIARNTIMEAGDVLKCWVHYGAITPGISDHTFSVCGDESDV